MMNLIDKAQPLAPVEHEVKAKVEEITKKYNPIKKQIGRMMANDDDDDTTERPIEINPIEMKDMYLPQDQKAEDKKQPTYVHQAFLPQTEDTYIHNVQLTQIPGGATYETIISLPRVHFFELPQIDLPYEVEVLV